MSLCPHPIIVPLAFPISPTFSLPFLLWPHFFVYSSTGLPPCRARGEAQRAKAAALTCRGNAPKLPRVGRSARRRSALARSCANRSPEFRVPSAPISEALVILAVCIKVLPRKRRKSPRKQRVSEKSADQRCIAPISRFWWENGCQRAGNSQLRVVRCSFGASAAARRTQEGKSEVRGVYLRIGDLSNYVGLSLSFPSQTISRWVFLVFPPFHLSPLLPTFICSVSLFLQVWISVLSLFSCTVSLSLLLSQSSYPPPVVCTGGVSTAQ